MTDIVIQQMPAFKRVYKKLHKQHQTIVNEAIVNEGAKARIYGAGL